MAARRRRRTTRARRVYTRRRRSRPMAARKRRYARRAAGGIKPIVDGALAGTAAGVLSGYIGAWGAPIGTLAIGYFRKNNTLKTLGGYELGGYIANMLPFGGSGGNGGGFFHS